MQWINETCLAQGSLSTTAGNNGCHEPLRPMRKKTALKCTLRLPCRQKCRQGAEGKATGGVGATCFVGGDMSTHAKALIAAIIELVAMWNGRRNGAGMGAGTNRGGGMGGADSKLSRNAKFRSFRRRCICVHQHRPLSTTRRSSARSAAWCAGLWFTLNISNHYSHYSLSACSGDVDRRTRPEGFGGAPRFTQRQSGIIWRSCVPLVHVPWYIAQWCLHGCTLEILNYGLWKSIKVHHVKFLDNDIRSLEVSSLRRVVSGFAAETLPINSLKGC